MFLRETKNSISVIPIFRNGTSILLDDLTFHVYKICNFIFVLESNIGSGRSIQVYPDIRSLRSKIFDFASKLSQGRTFRTSV